LDYNIEEPPLKLIMLILRMEWF